MKVTLEELQAFTSVIDCGSITAAAEQRNQTTSGISRALSRLEKKLATTLLRRTTRRLELTEEGELFLSHARQIIAAVDDAEEQIALRRLQPAGRLRVNAAAPFMQHVIVPMVTGFRALYPQIILELNTDDLNIDLLEQRTDIAIRIGALRDRLLKGVSDIEHVYVNGDLDRRVPHNLNVSFAYVEGESMLMAIKDLAVSSGSACTSASLEPSYVLRALGRDDELAHSSIRFTIGRFNTEEEIDFAIKLLHEKIGKLRELSPLWEMVQEGVDLNTVQWAAH